jgi:hypothetical protein
LPPLLAREKASSYGSDKLRVVAVFSCADYFFVLRVATAVSTTPLDELKLRLGLPTPTHSMTPDFLWPTERVTNGGRNHRRFSTTLELRQLTHVSSLHDSISTPGDVGRA